MWPWRKKKAQEPVRQKRKPREWTIPKEHAVELIGLFDDMMAASRFVPGIGSLKSRHLPRYLFWQKAFEVLPEIEGFAVQVEPVKDYRCIKIVENVPDGEFEPEPTIDPEISPSPSMPSPLEDTTNG